MIERLLSVHPSPRDCVMAAEAGVGRIVLTHLLPDSDPTGVERSGYAGEVIVGADLDVIEV